MKRRAPVRRWRAGRTCSPKTRGQIIGAIASCSTPASRGHPPPDVDAEDVIRAIGAIWLVGAEELASTRAAAVDGRPALRHAAVSAAPKTAGRDEGGADSTSASPIPTGSMSASSTASAAWRSATSGSVRLLSRNDLSMNGRSPHDRGLPSRSSACRGASRSTARWWLSSRVGRPASLSSWRTARAKDLLLRVRRHSGWTARTCAPLVAARAQAAAARRDRPFTDPLLLHDASQLGDGVDFYREACRRGWEGLIAKRADSPVRQRSARATGSSSSASRVRSS